MVGRAAVLAALDWSDVRDALPRLLVAAAAGAFVTSVQLGLEHGRAPFHDYRQKALGWWLAVAALDGSIAVLAVAIASETGSGSAGRAIGWALIGVLAPLGLRSPVFKQTEFFGRKVEPGFTYVYDIARTWFSKNLRERMRSLGRRARDACTRLALENGWEPATLLGLIEDDISDLSVSDLDRTRIREGAYRALAVDDVRTSVRALVRLLIAERKHPLLEQISRSRPDAQNRADGEEATRKAKEFLRLEAEAVSALQSAAEALQQVQPSVSGLPPSPDAESPTSSPEPYMDTTQNLDP